MIDYRDPRPFFAQFDARNYAGSDWALEEDARGRVFMTPLYGTFPRATQKVHDWMQARTFLKAWYERRLDVAEHLR